jgi:NADPH:quinone reductase
VKAAYLNQTGGPEVLHFGDIPDPEIGPKDVLVRNQAIALEGGDLFYRRAGEGLGPFHVIGYQGAGVVEAVGSEVRRFSAGDRVTAFHWSGSHAELMSAPEETVFAVPDGLDIIQAAMAPVAFGTANEALFEIGGLRAGETVFIHGASSGVGIAAVQLAAAAGARVIGTASSDARLDRLRELGMTEGVNRRGEGIAARVRAANNGERIDLYLETAADENCDNLLKILQYRGRMVAIGSLERNASLEVMNLIMRGGTVHGMLFGREMGTLRVREMLAGLMERMAKAEIVMPIDRIFSLADAAQAHHHAEQGSPFGRIVLTP